MKFSPLKKTGPSIPVITTGLALLLSACTTPDISLKPAVELNPAFATGGESATPDKWWESLQSSELDAHIEEALENNLSLEAAWQRLNTAKALSQRAGADKRPSLDADADIRFRETDSSDGTLSGSLGLAASYEVDFWGRINSQVEALAFRTQAAYADAQTVALTISSEVALAWLSLIEAEQRSALLENQIEINQNIEEVLLARFSSGQIDSADVLRQRQLIESTRQQLFAAEARIKTAQNRLRILKGLASGVYGENNDSALPALPALPDPGIPSELIEKRPDVRAAYFDLFADDAELAAAVANQYPRFNISASLSSSATSLNGLFDTWIASVVGGITAPLFDGGSRRAEVDRRAAIVFEKVASYSQTILEACQEVEDALVSESSQKQVFESLNRELELNEQTYAQLRTRYLNGATDYLSVLSNLREGQQLQRDILSARVNLLNNRVGLYRALAGGVFER